MASNFSPPHARPTNNWRGQGRNSPYRNNGRRAGPNGSPMGSSASSSSGDVANPRGYTTHRAQYSKYGCSSMVAGPARPHVGPKSHFGMALAGKRPYPGVPHEFQTPELLSEAYKSWSEVHVRVYRLPREFTDTWQLYNVFSQYGQISYIRLENHGVNDHDGLARVVLSTTPTSLPRSQTTFWHPQHYPFVLTLSDGYSKSGAIQFRVSGPRDERIVSPLDTNRRFLKIQTIPAGFLNFGLMSNEDELLGMHMITSTPKHPIILQMDLSDGRQKIDIRFSAHPDHQPQNMSRYRLQANLQLVAGVMRHRAEDRQCLAISFQDPPKYYRQTANPEKTHDADADQWKEWTRMWERQTDIDNYMQGRDTEPISLVRTDPIIDTGRWLTYRLDLKHDEETIQRVDEFCLALNHHNVQVKDVSELPLLNRTETEAWKYLDPHKASQPSDLHQMQDDLVHLDFDVRYQLEACISQHCINEYNMNLAFFQQLSGLDKATALTLLENVADSRFLYHDPMTIFVAPELRASRKRRAPHGCVLMHAVTITPTTLRISTPTVEVSNRVIRDYSHVQDRFLRVKFEDEDYIGRLWASATSSNQEEVYLRIERALKQGIDIAGRHYDFLASGCSQFREHGGYFFARLPNLNADMVRESLGQFQVINVVAKYAARIGQCFSTTRSVRQLPRNLNCVTINDVHGKVDQKVYCFTDGVGGVSPFVARLIADEFRINCPAGGYPSVFQFRMGGNKGVLAVNPSLKGITVALRPSQRKFESNTQGLEIIRVSSYATAFLNQQIILVLSSLGVPDKVFVDMMVKELKRIDLAMTHRQTALDLLLKNVDFNQVTIAMAEMIMDGFMDTKEPFVLSLLQLWRAWRMKFLEEKAHMAVEQGAFVLGCTDETKTLSMNSEGGVPEIFIQVKDDAGNYKPQEGICLLARNPSLHPGDVRVVQAVLCSKLLHLKDVVVLPQRGDRDLANMCSGGDLDGDDYLVMWDQALFPPKQEWNQSPMDFTPPTSRMSVGVVTKEQLTENFINYIKNDRLGTVATLHRAWADWHSTSGGVKHENCQRLAQLHSIAVDFPKSGIPAEIDEYLYQPPKWPHWMEKKGKPKDKIHHSKAVLGQLYDKVVREAYFPQYTDRFDQRVLSAYEIAEETLLNARELKKEYDADIRRIMAQQGVQTETEIWTAFVMSHNREKTDYVFAEEMGRLVGLLKEHHRDVVLQKVGIDKKVASLGDEDFVKLAPFVAAMYRVTKEEYEAAERSVRSSSSGNDSDSDLDAEDSMKPLMSFPWLFQREMGRIATRDTPAPRELVAMSAAVSAPKRRQFGLTNFAPDFSGMLLPALPEARLQDFDRASSTTLSNVGIPAAVHERGDLISGSKAPSWEELRQDFKFSDYNTYGSGHQVMDSGNVTTPFSSGESTRPPSLTSSRSSVFSPDEQGHKAEDGAGDDDDADDGEANEHEKDEESGIQDAGARAGAEQEVRQIMVDVGSEAVEGMVDAEGDGQQAKASVQGDDHLDRLRDLLGL